MTIVNGPLNIQRPKIDKELNGDYYDQETEETGVIYRILNVITCKSYIGRAKSYSKDGYRHGSIGRFNEHWTAAHGKSTSKKYNDCPVFYSALRDSNRDDWLVFVLVVCSIEDLKDQETELIQEHKTSNPKYGYNIFVGNNKPDNEEYNTKYVNKKCNTNTERAIGGKMKWLECNKNNPPCIKCHEVNNNGTISKGYLVDKTLNGRQHRMIFTSSNKTMEEKLDQAKKYLAIVIKEEANGTPENIPKGRKKKHDNTGIDGICYFKTVKDEKTITEGYKVEKQIDGKRYRSTISSKTLSKEQKLKLAIKKLKSFELEAKQLKKKLGSKTTNPKRKNKARKPKKQVNHKKIIEV